MKRVSVTFILAMLCIVTWSQESESFYFYKSSSALDVSEIDQTGLKHPMGLDIALKLEKMREVYTYVEDPTPQSPAPKTVIIKPTIYNSIQKLNRYYKKAIKKGEINKDSAIVAFDHCLNVGLCAIAEGTENFESVLKQTKTAEDILLVYQSVELR